MTKKIIGLFIVILACFFSGCTDSDTIKLSHVNNGVLYISDWDLTQETYHLDGAWEFYWNRFVSYEELKLAKPDLYAEVPNSWNDYSINGEKLKGEGFATYRLHVITDLEKGTMLGLRLYNFSSAYQLYINDRLMASNGRIADNATEETGEYRPQAASFPTPDKEFDIILQVSNYEYARGGFWYSVSIGSAEKILEQHDHIMGKEYIIIGVLAMISIYYFAIYLLSREFKFSLYFSCFCIMLILTIDSLGQFILFRLVPVDLNTIIYIWYSATNWVIFFMILMFHEMYRSGFSKVMVRLYLIIFILYQIVITVTEPIIYTRLADLTNLIDVVAILCTMVIIIIGLMKGHKDAWLNICCMVIILVTYIHDILFWTNQIRSDYGEIIYIGIFLCVLLQVLLQTRRIRQFYNQTVATELAFLQAQIKPHFLYNAINTFISITYYDVEQARELLRNFAEYLRRSFDFRSLDQFVPLKNELELVKAYVAIEQVRFEERLEVSFDIPEEMEHKVPILILQPIVENAVLHGVLPKAEGGHVFIKIRVEGKLLKFAVRDDGVGMELKSNILMENKTGSRVGLNNISKRLKKLYGKGLLVESEPGEGTVISWSIPIKGGKNRWK